MFAVGKHADDKWKLRAFRRPVGFQVVFDQHPGRTVSRNEFLAAAPGHDGNLSGGDTPHEYNLGWLATQPR